MERVELGNNDLIARHDPEQILLLYATLASNGTRMVAVQSRGKARVTVVDLRRDKSKLVDSFDELTGTDWNMSWAAITADGATVAYIAKRKPKSGQIIRPGKGRPVVLRNLNTGEEKLIDVAADGGLAFSPNHQLLAFAHVDSSIWLWNLETWERSQLLE
jgi:hypothetical protein